MFCSMVDLGREDIPIVMKLDFEMHALCCMGELRWAG